MNDIITFLEKYTINREDEDYVDILVLSIKRILKDLNKLPTNKDILKVVLSLNDYVSDKSNLERVDIKVEKLKLYISILKNISKK